LSFDSEVKGNLTDRKKLILKAVIEAHIETGEPVGSKLLTTNKQIMLSSATIRNEMAELEEMGYLEQPHTSAGRVPSEKGYRFYVDTLMEDYQLNASELSLLNSLLSSRLSAIDKMVEKASSVMAALTNYTSLAIRPKPKKVVVVRFKTLLLGDYDFLLIMITSSSVVNTKNIRTREPIDAWQLELLGAALNRFMVGVDINDITLPMIMQMEIAAGRGAPLVSSVIKCVYEFVSELNDEIDFEGVNRLLQYPEYSDMELLRDMLRLFERKDDIINIVAGGRRDATNIYIGSENRVDEMKSSTIVFKTIMAGGRPVGAIGVIGPCRMDYPKVVTTLEYLTGHLSEIAAERVAARLPLPGDGETDDNDNQGRK